MSKLPARYAPPAPNPLDEYQLVILAREIAMGIHSIPTILQRFRLTDAQYDTIQKIPFFVKVLANEKQAWESTLNTEKRTQLKALAMFEDIMPTVYVRMRASHEQLKDVIEGAKLIAKVAGIGDRPEREIQSGEKFAITINLGEDQKLRFEKEITPTSPLSNHPSGSSIQIQSLDQGEGSSTPISSDPKRD